MYTILSEPYISLIDGESDREGRVEIYNRGQWGTIPGEFSHVEASYVCRKLGYLGGVFAGNGFFGAGSGPFLALNVTCLRTRWCTAVNAVTHPEEYSHESDVGVICGMFYNQFSFICFSRIKRIITFGFSYKSSRAILFFFSKVNCFGAKPMFCNSVRSELKNKNRSN